MEKTECQNNS